MVSTQDRGLRFSASDYASLPPRALQKNFATFARPKGPDLLERGARFCDWIGTRVEHGLWPFGRALGTPPGSTVEATDLAGVAQAGINFASQDYLSLAGHPSIREAAMRALDEFGPHSAASPALMGNTQPSLKLESVLAERFGMEHGLTFPTGWAAGFATVVGLVRQHDFIVMDELAHACLQQGAQAATPNILINRHLDHEHVRAHLRDIRMRNAKAGILVITESLFSMDSDVPDLARLQEDCRELGATLLVDCAHDFGCLGPGGTGHLGMQNMLGKVDLVLGSFSKTFASNGGFLVTDSLAAKRMVQCFGGPYTFSNALSPVQAAAVLAAFDIVFSEEGDALRRSVARVAETLRGKLAGRGIPCIGDLSPVVPVPIGNERLARISYRMITERGLIANLVEFPAVAVGKARFRMQCMAGHTAGQVAQAADIVIESIEEARGILASADHCADPQPVATVGVS